MRFENSANGYVEEVSLAPLWCLLFGCIYFAVKGVWSHAVAAFLLAIFTAGISWIIYPFFATQIMQTNYLRRGWIQISERAPDYYIDGNGSRRSIWGLGKSALVALLLIFAAIIVASFWYGGQARDDIRRETSPNSIPMPPVRPFTSSQSK